MKNKKTLGIIGFLLGFSLLKPLDLQAQEAISYLLFDANKMQKLDYAATDNFPDMPFWDYQLTISDNKKLLFRVVKMDIYMDTVAALDKKPLTCDQPGVFTPELIEAVNNSSRYIYIVEEKTKGVILQRQVNSIVQLTETANSLTYLDRNKDFEYFFDKTYKDEERNLSLRKEKGAKVLLQSSDAKKECARLRVFRTFSGHSEDPFQDATFLEGIGLYTVREGKSELKLMSVNDVPADNYIKAYCTQLAQKEKDVLKNAEVPKNTDDIYGGGGSTSTDDIYGGGGATSITTTKKDTANPDDQKIRTGLSNSSGIGGTHAPNDGILYEGTGGTSSMGANIEFVLPTDANPCDGVSPLDVNNPCNNIVITNKPITAVLPPPADGIYVAEATDNLYKIANKFGITTKVLMCLNNKKDYSVGVMEKFLVVDVDGKCSISANPISRIDNEKRSITKIHVVEQGETLGKIAAKYGITLNKLCEKNGLTTETMGKIQIDQEIIISVESF